MQRINWMDWAKFLAVALTIPCHVPQEHGAQPVTYIEVFLLQVLFFNSGYLKKVSNDWKGNLHKYWHGLVIPYLIYNLLFYPYWLTKFYMENHTMPTMEEALHPIAGMLFLQIETSISCWLNPVTYFLAALLIMHLILDFCNSIRHGQWLMVGLCILGVVLYTVSKYNYFTRDLVTVGIFKSIPFYYMGHLCRRHHIFEKCNPRKDTPLFFLILPLSIVLFHYHATCEAHFAQHMVSFWPAVLFGLLAFIYFCKILNGIRSSIIVNYSNGTMAFIGLHWMITGSIRYGILKPILHVPTDYVYSPVEAYMIGVVVTLLLYPIILFFLKKAPWMLGKQSFK